MPTVRLHAFEVDMSAAMACGERYKSLLRVASGRKGNEWDRFGQYMRNTIVFAHEVRAFDRPPVKAVRAGLPPLSFWRKGPLARSKGCCQSLLLARVEASHGFSREGGCALRQARMNEMHTRGYRPMRGISVVQAAAVR